MTKDICADALYHELRGIGATLEAIGCSYDSCGTVPTELTMQSALFSIQEHIYRIADEWRIYTEQLEKSKEECLIESNKAAGGG
jgi:hypothetical protein